MRITPTLCLRRGGSHFGAASRGFPQNALDVDERETARSLYDAHLRHFLRPAFNEDILYRALALLGDRDLSAFDELPLRWAAVEARAAAHEVVKTVPLPKI